jgi:hypothetical protein
MRRINLVRRLPRMSWSPCWGRLIKALDSVPLMAPIPATRGKGRGKLPHSFDMGCGPCRVLNGSLLQPDFVHGNPPIAQKTYLDSLDVWLIQILEDMIVLGNPWSVVHDEAFGFAVEFDPTRIISRLPSFIE